MKYKLNKVRFNLIDNEKPNVFAKQILKEHGHLLVLNGYDKIETDLETDLEWILGYDNHKIKTLLKIGFWKTKDQEGIIVSNVLRRYESQKLIKQEYDFYLVIPYDKKVNSNSLQIYHAYKFPLQFKQKLYENAYFIYDVDKFLNYFFKNLFS